MPTQGTAPSHPDGATTPPVASRIATKQYRQTRFRRPPGSTELFIVRHGESEPLVPGNPFPLVDGHGDPALAPEGRAQADRVATRLADHAIDAIYVTSLRRTVETAAHSLLGWASSGSDRAGPARGPPRRVGGRVVRHRVAEGHPIALRMITEERWDIIPGAESPSRCGAGARGAAADRRRPSDERVVIVTHGGVIAEIMAQVADTRRPFAFLGCDNASISHVVAFAGRWILRRFNDTAHLERDSIVNRTSIHSRTCPAAEAAVHPRAAAGRPGGRPSAGGKHSDGGRRVSPRRRRCRSSRCCPRGRER